MEHDFNRNVGRRLYEARKAKGYSRAKVGEMVGLHESTVKRYEDGDIKSLDIERLKAFAKALGTPAAEIIGWLSDTDEHLELMLSISQENASGRTNAKEEMFRTFGAEHFTNSHRLIEGKVALLYYRAMEQRKTAAMSEIIKSLEDLNPKELESMMLMIGAYLNADQPIKDIVDTALRPYVDKELESWT